jgi:hypothetical protein
VNYAPSADRSTHDGEFKFKASSIKGEWCVGGVRKRGLIYRARSYLWGVAPARRENRTRERNADDIVGVYWCLARTHLFNGWMDGWVREESERPAKLLARATLCCAHLHVKRHRRVLWVNGWIGIGSSTAR